MSNRFLASLASLFLGASFVLGQTPSSQQGATLEPGPAPKQAPSSAAAGATATPTKSSSSDSLWDACRCYFFGDPALSSSRPLAHDQDAAGLGAAPCGKTCDAFTVDVEYLLWFLANSHDTTPIAATNFLANSGAQVLGAVGDAEHPKAGPTSGGRLTSGYWQYDDNFWVPGGIRDFGGEAVFFFVGQRGLNVHNDATPDLVRPFFDLNNRQESGFIVAAPGLATGEISGHAQANLWGGEINAWKNIYYSFPGTTGTVAMMAGFRYLSGDEEIQIGSVSVFDPNISPASPFFPFAGNKLDVFDSFTTHNRFYGAQVGISGKCYLIDQFSIEGVFKLGLGVTSEDLNIEGGQLRTFANGSTAVYQGGLLALPSNIGSFHRDKFAQVPELDFKMAYAVSKNLSLNGGFSTLYWSRIARAGQQIDREIDITQIPNFPQNAGAIPTGLGRPGVPFTQSDLWALGASLGLEFKW
jgi:Putative beta barrel porin-7 (BBP7)